MTFTTALLLWLAAGGAYVWYKLNWTHYLYRLAKFDAPQQGLEKQVSFVAEFDKPYVVRVRFAEPIRDAEKISSCRWTGAPEKCEELLPPVHLQWKLRDGAGDVASCDSWRMACISYVQSRHYVIGRFQGVKGQAYQLSIRNVGVASVPLSIEVEPNEKWMTNLLISGQIGFALWCLALTVGGILFLAGILLHIAYQWRLKRELADIPELESPA